MRFKVGDKVQVKSLKEILEDPNTESAGDRIVTSYLKKQKEK